MTQEGGKRTPRRRSPLLVVGILFSPLLLAALVLFVFHGADPVPKETLLLGSDESL